MADDNAAIASRSKQDPMLSWLARRRAKIVRLDVEAEALIRDLGDRAYSEALRRQRESSSDEIAKDWGRIASAVARKSGKQVGLDTATRMAIDADFSLEPHQAESAHQPPEETDPVDELMRIVSDVRIHLIGLLGSASLSVLTESTLN